MELCQCPAAPGRPAGGRPAATYMGLAAAEMTNAVRGVPKHETLGLLLSALRMAAGGRWDTRNFGRSGASRRLGQLAGALATAWEYEPSSRHSADRYPTSRKRPTAGVTAARARGAAARDGPTANRCRFAPGGSGATRATAGQPRSIQPGAGVSRFGIVWGERRFDGMAPQTSKVIGRPRNANDQPTIYVSRLVYAARRICPPANAATVSTTRSCWAVVISGKIGKAITSRQAASLAGNSPDRCPRYSRQPCRCNGTG
jgi:hypothetical protein